MLLCPMDVSYANGTDQVALELADTVSVLIAQQPETTFYLYVFGGKQRAKSYSLLDSCFCNQNNLI